MGTILPLLLLTVVASALFAGLETGVVSLSRVRLRVRARRGDTVASTLLRLLERPERILTTFLIGNTLSNVGGGALASYAAIRLLGIGETVGSLTATAVMTVIFLVFSELAPKTYFRRHAEDGGTALPVVHPRRHLGLRSGGSGWPRRCCARSPGEADEARS